MYRYMYTCLWGVYFSGPWDIILKIANKFLNIRKCISDMVFTYVIRIICLMRCIILYEDINPSLPLQHSI